MISPALRGIFGFSTVTAPSLPTSSIRALVGAAMVQWRYVDYSLEVWISALYAAPIVALAPILIIWFGFGPWSKVAVVFIMVVFPMIINTQAGLESVDREVRWLSELIEDERKIQKKS